MVGYLCLVRPSIEGDLVYMPAFLEFFNLIALTLGVMSGWVTGEFMTGCKVGGVL